MINKTNIVERIMNKPQVEETQDEAAEAAETTEA